jgi:hypothetical protein
LDARVDDFVMPCFWDIWIRLVAVTDYARDLSAQMLLVKPKGFLTAAAIVDVDVESHVPVLAGRKVNDLRR